MKILLTNKSTGYIGGQDFYNGNNAESGIEDSALRKAVVPARIRGQVFVEFGKDNEIGQLDGLSRRSKVAF
jgi:hypothetical protein